MIAVDGRSLECLAYGGIHLPAQESFANRLCMLGENLNKILSTYPIDVMAVETVFCSKNSQSALKLGHARGVVLYIGTSAHLELFEYSPASIKMALVGYGRAAKDQLQFMVQRLLSLKSPPTPADASDALAVAICHANSARLQRRMIATHDRIYRR